MFFQKPLKPFQKGPQPPITPLKGPLSKKRNTSEPQGPETGTGWALVSALAVRKTREHKGLSGLLSPLKEFIRRLSPLKTVLKRFKAIKGFIVLEVFVVV